QFHAVRSVGPSRSDRRRPARRGRLDAVRAGDRSARRDQPARRRLESHTERGMGRPTGGTTRLIYYRSREVIPCTHAGRRRGALARVWPRQFSLSGSASGLALGAPSVHGVDDALKTRIALKRGKTWIALKPQDPFVSVADCALHEFDRGVDGADERIELGAV